MNSPDKILVLFGSPNKQGFTNSLLKIYLEELQSRLHNSSDLEYVYAYERNYLPCNGCNKCKNSGKCVLNIKDNYNELIDSIYKANHVIIASPVYFNGFPGPLKNIIDRTQQRYYIKFGSKHKQENKRLNNGSLIAACGANTTKFFDSLVTTTRMFFDCLDVAFAEKLFAINTDNPESIKISDTL